MYTVKQGDLCVSCGVPTVYTTRKRKYCSTKCKYQASGKRYQAEWSNANREHKRQIRRHWNAANRKRIYAKKQAWMNSHPEEAKAMLRRGRLKRYGISLEDYDHLYDLQGGKCAACKTSAPRSGRDGLVVDHNHETHKVRALLCGPCNRTLGHAKEDSGRLRAVLEYLELHKSPCTIN